jgi:hypothetical protein
LELKRREEKRREEKRVVVIVVVVVVGVFQHQQQTILYKIARQNFIILPTGRKPKEPILHTSLTSSSSKEREIKTWQDISAERFR